MDLPKAQARIRRQQRGSALLLSLLVTVVGGAILGLTVDVTSLVWARANAQTTATLAAASLQLELSRNSSAADAYLETVARATAAHNGCRHGSASAVVQVLKHDGGREVLVARPAPVFFLRMFHVPPVTIRARAPVVAAAQRASR